MNDPAPPAGSPSWDEFLAEAQTALDRFGRRLGDLRASADPEVAAAACKDLEQVRDRASWLGRPEAARLASGARLAVRGVRERYFGPTPALLDALSKVRDALQVALTPAAGPPPSAVARDLEAAATELAAVPIPPPSPSGLRELDPAPLPIGLRELPPTPPPPPEPAVPAHPAAWPPPGVAVAAEVVGPFLAEAADSLHQAETALLELEQNPDNADALNQLFRAIHSIKGTADYVGLAQIKTLSHRVEGLLARARSGRLDFAAVGELVFRGFDELRAMVGAVAPAGEVGRDLAGLIATIDAVLDCPPDPTAAGAAGDGPGGVFDRAAPQYLQCIADCLRAVARGDLSDDVLRTLRRAAGSLQGSAAFVGRGEYAGPAAEVVAAVDRFWDDRRRLDNEPAVADEEHPAVTAVAGPPERPGPVAAAHVELVPARPPAPAAPAASPLPAGGAVPTAQAGPAGKTMRVDQRKLDEYINLAGELVIARNALTHAFQEFQSEHPCPRALKEAVEKVHRIVADVQSNAMAMRMVPVSTVFQRFPRMVRDVAKTLNKQIGLELYGEETELDKQVAEALGDPLVHLIRNAADHGVEPPAARAAAGKPEAGTIALRAGRDGNAIHIDIEDDGGGIDPDRLRAKAVENGLMTADRAAGLSREEALELIFAPGLSTAKVVSDLSGRGVGMDVVRSNVIALGGAVFVDSEAGKGTRIRVQLPLTLAVTTAVLVRVGGSGYALPIDAVRETVKLRPAEVKSLKGVKAFSRRGEIVPLRTLDAVLAGRPDGREWRADTSGRYPVAVVGAGGEAIGLVVDEFCGKQEIVIKPLPPQLGQLAGFSGAAIMGDGSVVLVVDPGTVITAPPEPR